MMYMTRDEKTLYMLYHAHEGLEKAIFAYERIGKLASPAVLLHELQFIERLISKYELEVADGRAIKISD